MIMIKNPMRSVLLFTGCLCLFGSNFGMASDIAAAEANLMDRIARGQAIAYDRNAGNCLSCHLMPDSELPGNIGPPLIQMKLRYPKREDLVSQIFDAARRNPNTVMPPYGRHNILTNEEIDLVVDFIHSI